jgi:hypothetical protein
MEVLNALIVEADRRAVLTLLPDRAVKCWALVYADDLVVFLHPSARDFNCIRQILELFAGASGLSTNLDKCTMTLICCSQEDIQAVQHVFPCRIQEFPTKYLGAPLSLSRLGHADEQQLVEWQLRSQLGRADS